MCTCAHVIKSSEIADHISLSALESCSYLSNRSKRGASRWLDGKPQAPREKRRDDRVRFFDR